MATGFLWKSLTRGPHCGLLLLGTVLPDLACRAPALGMARLVQAGLDIPPQLIEGLTVRHLRRAWWA